MMAVRTVKPEIQADELLKGAQFVDAYRVSIDNLVVDARRITEAMFARPPRWINALIALRNQLVAPFGLKTPAPEDIKSDLKTAETIGIFPLVSVTRDRVVAGFDDKHLDFRVIVDVSPGSRRRLVTATTLVRTHNFLGRAYLATVLPFHKMIVPSLLRQLTTYY
jgi:hypothetical protein